MLTPAFSSALYALPVLYASQTKQVHIVLLPRVTEEASHCPLCAELHFSTEPSVLETFPEHNQGGVLIHFQQYSIYRCEDVP